MDIFYSITLFSIGILGIFTNRKNIIIMLMSVELILLSVNYLFIILSINYDDIMGQMFGLMILTIAAAESAIGLAILVVLYTVRGTIAVEYLNLMKG
jgi:NADH-quinone oxidoreductase subunit K